MAQWWLGPGGSIRQLHQKLNFLLEKSSVKKISIKNVLEVNPKTFFGYWFNQTLKRHLIICEKAIGINLETKFAVVLEL